MNIQDQTKPTTTSGHESDGVHIFHRCGGPSPNSHPNSNHKKICGTIEGFTNKLIDSEIVSDHDDDQEDHSDHDEDDDDDHKEKTPSPKIEKRIIKEGGTGGTEERSNYSEDLFSDAKTDFSDSLLSPGVQERFLDATKLLDSPIKVKKVDDSLEVFQTPDTGVKDANKTDENVHKDDFIDRMNVSSKDVGIIDNKDQEYVLSVASDVPLVDHAERLMDDFKDHKTMYSNVPHGDINVEIRSVVDSFEVKTAKETIQESQPSKAEGVNEEINREVVSVPVLTEVKQPDSGIDAEQKIMESVNDDDSKDSGKVVISESFEQSHNASGVVSETVVDEGDVKLLTSQDYGVDASVYSSSRNSLEGNWGSVSVLSTASIDAENAHKSEISSDKRRLGKSEASEGPSLVGPTEQIVEKSSEIKADTVKVQISQPSKSEANMSNETQGRKRNDEAIAKVKNWTTNENPVTESKSFNPKQLSVMVQKDEAAEKTGEPKKSNMDNQDPSPKKYISDGKKVEKKSKRPWVPFGCCFSLNE